jgi:hypothetical protein
MIIPESNKTMYPVWFRIINLTILIPVIFWPVVLFGSIFIFDNPGNFFLTLLLFVLILAYPIYLFFLLKLNKRLFRFNRLIATLFPLIFSSVIVIYMLNFLGGPSAIIKFFSMIGNKPQIETDYANVIGFNYRKDATTLYYGDSIVPNADLSTFQLINFEWARDRNTIYYMGVPVPKIDTQSFTYLGSGYSMDTNYVYYDTMIVEGADRNNFYFIAESQDGKDDNFCYRKGIKTDCSVLTE